MVKKRTDTPLDLYLARRRGSMTELAKKLDITIPYLCEIRKGRAEPSLGLALRISRETGVPVESLERRAA